MPSAVGFFRESGIPDAKGRAGHFPNRIEAESMKLDGYVVKDVTPWEDASGGKAIACETTKCTAIIHLRRRHRHIRSSHPILRPRPPLREISTQSGRSNPNLLDRRSNSPHQSPKRRHLHPPNPRAHHPPHRRHPHHRRHPRHLRPSRSRLPRTHSTSLSPRRTKAPSRTATAGERCTVRIRTCHPNSKTSITKFV